MPHRPPENGGGVDVDVAVIIVNYRTPTLTLECLSALCGERHLLPGLRAIVVDGGSGDGSATTLGAGINRPEYQDWVSFMPLPLNGGFGWANNQAILTLARKDEPPDFIHLLNPDTQIMKGAVATLVSELSLHPRCGAAGSLLLDSEGQPSPSAFPFPSPGIEFVNTSQSELLGRWFGVPPRSSRSEHSVEVDWVTGASVMFRTKALRETGLFDDGFFLYFEEVELMHRLHRRGWTVRHVPSSRVVHHEGASTRTVSAVAMPAYWYESRKRYFKITDRRFSAIRADLASIAGRSAGLIKQLFGKRGVETTFRIRDLLRTRPHIRASSVPHLGDEPGKPPAWMAHS